MVLALPRPSSLRNPLLLGYRPFVETSVNLTRQGPEKNQTWATHYRRPRFWCRLYVRWTYAFSSCKQQQAVAVESATLFFNYATRLELS